jgi:mevalonate pyrophosphate decarboxylase
MSTKISNLLRSQLKKDYFSIINYLEEFNYSFEALPSDSKAKCDYLEAYTLAYPIQGVLKYHGLADLKNNIAFTPTISFNNSSGSGILTSNLFQNTIAWKPITLEIMLFLRNLRDEGLNNYFSIDTGPSVVVITHKKNKKILMKRIRNKFPEVPLIAGSLGGPARVLERDLLV